MVVAISLKLKLNRKNKHMNKLFSLNIFKKSFFIIFAAALVVSGFFIFGNVAKAEILNVCPATVDGCTYDSIQNAIDDADSGDTINVAAGEYKLDSQIRITKGINIIGAGDSTVITKGTTPWTNETGEKGHAPLITIISGAEAVRLENIKVTGAANISMTPSGTDYGHGINIVSSLNVTLNNVTSVSNAAAGLIVNSSNVTAENLNTSGNGWYGVNVDKADSGDASFTLTGNGLIAESTQIISDKTTGATVTATGYTPYKISGTTKTSWTNKPLSNVATITKEDASTLYATIQSAIDAATDGDTINVAAGTYNELITVNRSLNLTGANTGIPGSSLTRSNESNITGYVKINANNVSIDGFKFTDGAQVPAGEKSAVYIVGNHSGFEIKNNLFTRAGSAPYGFDQFRGIINEYGGINSIQITNNKFTGWHTGIYLQNAIATVTNNVMDGNMVGMSVDGPNSVSVTENIFNNNAFEGLGVGPGTGSYSLTAQQNIFSGNVTALANYISSYTVNAEKNWWGTASGPNHSTNSSGTGNPVSDHIVFSPWYANAEKTSWGGIMTPSGENKVLSLPTPIDILTTNLEVKIPIGTDVTGPTDGWDGTINAPTVKDVPDVTPSVAGHSTVIDTIIEVGFPGAKLTFNNAVRLLFPGKAGKRVGYVRTDGSFQEITTPCDNDAQTAADTQLIGDIEDCKIDVVPDLVVWTKHFTQFITYNIYLNSPGSGSPFPPPAPSPLGDTNGDNKVDKYDFSLMMANWGKIGSNNCDLNNDSKVDKYDFALLMLNWSM
jgi:hypothetical protein